ncbi:NAD(P)H-binding protein [Inquilinus sp.]|uniref:NAD(P)H-binding protein n=1 Tax=Inquilinus sp. TaxID=1932117 RepID=UPI0031D0631C
MQERKPILVVGGTGKTGRRVAERLTARGLPVRIGSRAASPAFDWENPSGWAAALDGAGAAYITYYPDLAAPGAPEAVGALVDQALAQGVRRLVLLSGRGEAEAQRAERVLQESGADWTIVRASWFSQNFSESVLLEGVLAGEIVLPADEVGEPFVDADDIADVVVAALKEDGHAGQLYEVTGPRLLTFSEAAAEIAKASGRPVRYTRVPADAFAAAMAEQGSPAEVTELLLYLFTTVLDGRNACLADGVQRALGRPPKDFADYARDAAASGVWAG